MNPVNITIYGRIPSKKNSRCLFVRGNKIVNIPSKRYKEWHKQASEQLVPYLIPQPLKSIKSVEILIFAPDKRKSDLTNKAESIMDLLVDSGILFDDNWNVVKEVTIKYGGLDREDPRCKIVIRKE